MRLFSAPEIFRFRRMVLKSGAENQRQEMESIYGAGFWDVCHGY